MPPAAVLPNGVLPHGVDPNGTSERVLACRVVRELSVPTGWSGTGVVPSSRLVKAAKSSCTACVPVAPLQALAGASQRATVAAFSPSPPLDVERRGSPTEDDAPPNVNFDVPGTGKNPLGSRTSTRKSEVVPHASAKVTW